MNLGEKIVAFRKEKNITQEELAELSKIALRTIQRIEKGESVPRGFTLKSIAQALDKQISDFTTPVENNNELAKEKVNSFLRLLNLLCLTYIIVPYGNLFIPWMVWKKKKDDNREIEIIGRRIIVFQFIWMAAVCLALLLGAGIQIFVRKFHGNQPGLILPVFFFMYLLNIPVILYTALHLKRGNHNIYRIASLFVS